MKTFAPVALAALLCAVGASAAPVPRADEPAQETPSAPPVYDEAADGAAQIAEALVQAKRNHRRVLIQWGANWCGWCIKLDETFRTDAKVRHELLYEYDLVHIDIGRFDKHMDLVAKYGLKLAGVPHLTILDEDGKLVAHENTEPLELKEEGAVMGHDPAKVLAMLESHRAPQTKARPLLRDAIDQARNREQRVFLVFGAPW